MVMMTLLTLMAMFSGVRQSTPKVSFLISQIYLVVMKSLSWVIQSIFVMVGPIENIPMELNLYWHTNPFIKFLFDPGPVFCPVSGFCISDVHIKIIMHARIYLFCVNIKKKCLRDYYAKIWKPDQRLFPK